MGRKPLPESVRFWRKVDTTNGPDACWIWRGSLAKKGYGQFSTVRDGRVTTIRAHRWAFLDAGGEIPADRQLHHTCNMPACVNPKHLQVVTAQENIAAIDHRARRAPIKFGAVRRTGEPSSTIAFHCPDALQARLRQTADSLNVSLSYLISAALVQFFALRLDHDEEVSA